MPNFQLNVPNAPKLSRDSARISRREVDYPTSPGDSPDGGFGSVAAVSPEAERLQVPVRDDQRIDVWTPSPEYLYVRLLLGIVHGA